MRVLKQSTAVTVLFGPYLDKTDAVTEEVGLGGAATEISKAGGAFAAGPTLGTHDSDGWYPISLTTTHTNTLGDLTIKGHDNATHLPVWMHFTVLPANAYDALVSGSGAGIRADIITYTGNTPQTGDSFALLGAPAGASVSADIAAIEAQTDDIGAAGAGLTAITSLLPAALTAAGNIKADVEEWRAAVPSALISGRVDANTQAMAAGVIASGVISVAALNEIADAILDRNMATGTDSGTNTLRTVRQALRTLRNKVDVGAGIVYKEDDTATSYSFSVTTAAGDPITVFDPASV